MEKNCQGSVNELHLLFVDTFTLKCFNVMHKIPLHSTHSFISGWPQTWKTWKTWKTQVI